MNKEIFEILIDSKYAEIALIIKGRSSFLSLLSSDLILFNPKRVKGIFSIIKIPFFIHYII